MRAEILKLLTSNAGAFISGEKLIKATGITRQGVWKHIQGLIEEGYVIESVKGQGYRIQAVPERLTQSQLETIVSESTLLEKAYHLETVGSTNAFLKEQAKRVNTALVVADAQSAGRGRLGRSWESAKGEGLWMSMLLRPPIQPLKASMLTQVVAVSMAKAIREVAGIQVQIKWPNDLMVGNRKVCGILTEMAAEINAIEYVIIGIGLNIAQGAFPDDLKEIATALAWHTNKPVKRDLIIARFLKCFSEDYQRFLEAGDLVDFVADLNALSYLKGHQVWLSETPEVTYLALGVSRDGELMLNDAQGQTRLVAFGEVSVRRKEYATGI